MASRSPQAPEPEAPWRLALVVLGVLGILIGLGTWLVLSDFGLVPRIFIAAGILLLGVYIALDPERVWSRLTGRGVLYTGNAVIIGLALLAMLGLVNVLASRYPGKADLTAQKQFTLSDQSIKVVQNLPDPVTVTAFFSSDDTGKSDYQARLNDYVAHSNGKLSVQFIDPTQQPAAARQAGIRTTGTTVYQMGDKKQNSTGTAEQDITSSLIKLTRPAQTVYFMVGHGERSLSSTDQTGYSQIKDFMSRDNYNATELNLETQRAVPDDAAAVVIAGPTGPLFPDEKDALKAYLDNGGKLMILLGPNQPDARTQPDLGDLLTRWQTAFSGNVVVDPGRALQNDPRIPVVSSYATHPTTTDFNGTATIYPLSTNITFPSQPPAGATITGIAQTTDRSWGNTNQQQIQQGPDDPKGPLSLVVSIEQSVSGASGATPTTSTSGTATNQVARVYLIGTPDFVSNYFMSYPAGNPDMFVNALNWLSGQNDLISINSPKPVSRDLLLTSTQINLAIYTSLLFLPLAVLAVGGAVWWARR